MDDTTAKRQIESLIHNIFENFLPGFNEIVKSSSPPHC